jgi:hypothetical protein
MTETDKALFCIYDELKTLRCLKQIELGLAISNTKVTSVSELDAITDMIANPKKYFVKDDTRKEAKDD